MSEHLSDVSDSQKTIKKEYTFLSCMLLVSLNKRMGPEIDWWWRGGGTSASGLYQVIVLFTS
jgi:hypothetical protein